MFQITQEECNVRREIVFILAANSILAAGQRTTEDGQQGKDSLKVVVVLTRLVFVELVHEVFNDVHFWMDVGL